MGKPQQKICPYCEKEFTAYHPNKKYCSSSHRMMAYHKRKGYKVITVLPEEKETLSDKRVNAVATQENQAGMNKPSPYIINPKSKIRTKAEDFAVNTGAGMLANYFTEKLKSEPNKAATKQDILDIHVRIDQLFQTLQKSNSNNESNKEDDKTNIRHVL